VPADSPIRHHELCFGCGQANLFGLQLELSPADGGAVEGRFFVKQDHQGPPGYAHGGVIAAALDEAMALLSGDAQLSRLEVDLLAPAPVGAFVDVRAVLDGRVLAASASVEGREVARARGRFAQESA
jgi:acyl-coenzyme A thioesterase PaaI-like protein